MMSMNDSSKLDPESASLLEELHSLYFQVINQCAVDAWQNIVLGQRTETLARIMMALEQETPGTPEHIRMSALFSLNLAVINYLKNMTKAEE